MKRIGCYYRVSTDKQELVSQRLAVEAWIKALPTKPQSVRVFQDEAISGANNDRPGYLAILEAAKRGEIDTIVCFKLDRFSRSATHAIRTIIDLDAMGVGFVATSQPSLNLSSDNPFRRTMLAVFADIAELERETIVSRVKAGMEAARKRGSKIGNQHLGEDQKAKIRNLSASGFSQGIIAKQLGLCRMTVWRVLAGRLDQKIRGDDRSRE